MKKFFERVIISAILVYVITVGIGMYSTWKSCSDEGGTTVRGVFGLECIRR